MKTTLIMRVYELHRELLFFNVVAKSCLYRFDLLALKFGQINPQLLLVGLDLRRLVFIRWHHAHLTGLPVALLLEQWLGASTAKDAIIVPAWILFNKRSVWTRKIFGVTFHNSLGFNSVIKRLTNFKRTSVQTRNSIDQPDVLLALINLLDYLSPI